MEAFELGRSNMAKGQVMTNGVYNSKLLSTLLEIPKHIFVPEEKQGIAYCDDKINIGSNRYILPPMIFAKMLEAMELTGSESALDIACGAGYSSAILAKLCKKVVAIESNSDLASKAHLNLNKVGINNVIIMVDELAQGHEADAPYDIILINGAVKQVPEKIFDQLEIGGRLAAVISKEDDAGQIVIHKKNNDGLAINGVFDVQLDLIDDFNYLVIT